MSADVAALIAAFDSGSLHRPRFDEPNIVDLSAALFGWASVAEAPETPNSGLLRHLLGDFTHLVFVVADGFGMNFVSRMEPSSFAARNMALEIQTVWPSTTSVVLTSLATARWPNEHGIVGWDMYLDEIDSVATIIRNTRRSDGVSLRSLGVGDDEAYPMPSLFGSVHHDLVSVVRNVADTPYSDYWNGHSPYITYGRFREGVNAAQAQLKTADAPTITHMYSDSIDGLAHKYGTGSSQVWKAIRSFDQQIERLATSLPTDARLIVTADHGHLQGDLHEILPTDPILDNLVREPWGDLRAMHFAVRAAETDEFEAKFRERFGEFALLLTAAEVEGLELMGPGLIGPLTARRMGTHIAISRGSATLKFIPEPKPEPHVDKSHHSGLTPDEMLVPLIVV